MTVCICYFCTLVNVLVFPVYFATLGNFEITPSGYIIVKKTLDAEVESQYNLTIEAKDEGQPSRSNTVSKFHLTYMHRLKCL